MPAPNPHPSRSAQVCAQCQHLAQPERPAGQLCNHPAAPVSLVSGQPSSCCRDQRAEETELERHRGGMHRCGPEGRWFEPVDAAAPTDACMSCGGTTRGIYARVRGTCPDCASRAISPATATTSAPL